MCIVTQLTKFLRISEVSTVWEMFSFKTEIHQFLLCWYKAETSKVLYLIISNNKYVVKNTIIIVPLESPTKLCL